MEPDFQPSQIFDIHEEYWKYCDDNSVRIVHFYEETSNRVNTPKMEDDQFLEDVINVISSLDEKEKVTEEKKEQPIVLDTPEKIFKHMATCLSNKTV